MEWFFGFDLGDAESAVARLEKSSQDEPEVLEIAGSRSFITACAQTANGELLLGEKACYQAQALSRCLRFKSRFLTDPASETDTRTFAGAVIGALKAAGAIPAEGESLFYIGCPAGWDARTRERYRSIFEKCGYPPARIVSESRAAMVSACQSRHLQVGYDILSKPVLVVDIGSSTTDFAYICGGREVEMQTAGEVALGGGLMDELLLEQALSKSGDAPALKKAFQASEPWRSYCEFAARRLKEKYFSDEAYWSERGCRESVRVHFGWRPLKLELRLDKAGAEQLLDGPCAALGGKSFHEVFAASLANVRAGIDGAQPELIFLTGGVSRMPAIRAWCEEAFPEAIVISSLEPEFSVARGLAWSGRIDAETRSFRAELRDLIASSAVEDIVSANVASLYRSVVDALVEPILKEVALPVFDRWRSGEIRRLKDADGLLQSGIADFIRSEAASEKLVGPITQWLRPVAEGLEEKTMPICVKHHIPYRALSLNSWLAPADLDIRVEAKNVFAVGELTWLIDSIISVIVGLICGGGGIALISGGPAGILAGMSASLLVLLLGKEQMEEALLGADIPVPLRKLVPKGAFQSRMDSLSAAVKRSFYESLEKDKNDEITRRMTEEISAQIEHCLTRMAEIVEIPLG